MKMMGGKYMSFEVQQSNVNRLFGRNIYCIPRNQRFYVWDKTNWEELFDDLNYTVKSGKSHFIGSFVLKREKENAGIPEFTIIDGQQRIITLTIMLVAVMYLMKCNNLLDDFEGTKQYVIATDNKAKYKVMVQSEYYYALEGLINSIVLSKENGNDNLNGLVKSIPNIFDNDKDVKLAFEYFVDQISKKMDIDKTKDYLIKFRDAIINTTYISIIADTEEDSYTIFEILNARGVALEDHELLKNYIMRYIEPNEIRDTAKEKWNHMETKLGKNMNKFIKHYVIHRCKYKDKKASDYKILKKYFSNYSKEDLLQDLLLKSEYYLKIIEPQNYCKKNTMEYSVFSFFKTTRQEQFRPILLGLIHHLSVGDLSQKAYNEILEYLFKFYVYYNIIGEEKSNKISNTVSKYAQLIESDCSEKNLSDFKNDMKMKLPTKEIFINSFKNIGYSHHNTFYKDSRKKKVVLLVLEVLEKNLNSGVCLENFTIEHIRDDKDDKLNGQIGNLLPLEKNLNEKLSGKTFEQKLEVYKNSNYATTRRFAITFRTKEFNIEQRTDYLAKMFYEILGFGKE